MEISKLILCTNKACHLNEKIGFCVVVVKSCPNKKKNSKENYHANIHKYTAWTQKIQNSHLHAIYEHI